MRVDKVRVTFESSDRSRRLVLGVSDLDADKLVCVIGAGTAGEYEEHPVPPELELRVKKTLSAVMEMIDAVIAALPDDDESEKAS